VPKGFLQRGFELIEAVLGRLQLLLEFAEPAGVGKIAGADDRDPLLLCPHKEVFGHKAPGGGARKVGVDVKVGDESHGKEYRT
jgi:hypothetical protein